MNKIVFYPNEKSVCLLLNLVEIFVTLSDIMPMLSTLNSGSCTRKYLNHVYNTISRLLDRA